MQEQINSEFVKLKKEVSDRITENTDTVVRLDEHAIVYDSQIEELQKIMRDQQNMVNMIDVKENNLKRQLDQMQATVAYRHSVKRMTDKCNMMEQELAHKT